MTERPGAWMQAVEDFLLEKRGARCSPRTLFIYRHCIAGPRVAVWLQDRGIERPEQVTPGDLRHLGEMLTAIGNVPGTLHMYHRTIKTFLRWCAAEGHEINERTLTLAAPKVPAHIPTVFTAEQLQILIKAARTPRDRFLIEFLVATGVRLHELCAATLDDIVATEAGGCWLVVRNGKGAKDRIVPLDRPGLRLSDKLMDYVERVRPRITHLREIFLSPPTRSLIDTYEPMSGNALRLMLDRLGKRTGIHVHAHAFRHTWATEALRGGVGMEALRRAGGWTQYRMVQRYSHYLPDDLVNAWQARCD